MLEEGKNILKYSPGNKSLKVPFIIYSDLETKRKAKNKPSGYSLSLNCLFDETKNRLKFCWRKDCVKKICNDLKELATEIINYKEKEMISLKDKEINSNQGGLFRGLFWGGGGGEITPPPPPLSKTC